jgi:hypothetical protein
MAGPAAREPFPQGEKGQTGQVDNERDMNTARRWFTGDGPGIPGWPDRNGRQQERWPFPGLTTTIEGNILSLR